MDNNLMKGFHLFIIGTTAAGKTKLSLSLAQQFKGEIVSSDSMQLYKKADIMTAKATKEEQALVKHHMIDVLDLNTTNFNRNDYYCMAQQCIQSIFNNPLKGNKFPIIVGGTHYYAETLLFQQQIYDENTLNQEKKQVQSEEIEKYISTTKLEEKYAHLKSIDPLLANKLHPHDERRIDNYLKSALISGHPPSENLQDHQSGQLRNKNCLIFWTRAKDFQALKNQQRKRIQEMVSLEGVKEIIFIFDYFFSKETQQIAINQENKNLQQNYPKGVMQSIGYKEFEPFYRFFKIQLQQYEIKQKAIDNEQMDQFIMNIMESKEGSLILSKCIESLIIDTAQYSKKQLKWIKHRILINDNLEEIKKKLFVFEFDEFTSENFNENVIQPALLVLEKYLNLLQSTQTEDEAINQLISDKNINKFLISQLEIDEAQSSHIKKGLKEWRNFICDLCNKSVHGEQQWRQHLKSKQHKKSQNKKVKRDKQIEKQQQLNTNNQEEESEEEKKNLDEKSSNRDEIGMNKSLSSSSSDLLKEENQKDKYSEQAQLQQQQNQLTGMTNNDTGQENNNQ